MSREISGTGADASEEVGGGGGLDFLRSRLAHEKKPPLPFFTGGVMGEAGAAERTSKESLDFVRP